MSPDPGPAPAPVQDMPCPSPLFGLARGTKVLTLRGLCLVDELAVGDRVITRDTGTAVLRQNIRRDVICCGIRFQAPMAAQDTPCVPAQERDIILPARHKVLVRRSLMAAMTRQDPGRHGQLLGEEAKLAQAEELVDNLKVHNLGHISMVLHDLRFDYDHIIYADGLEVLARRA